ncbi:MAG: hypothetical protein BMS9Abin13_361 [Patescibacteria group bacterium]|nr:MAG: hypothetical protein BMS9Abin13_361 [Patescibacteria group bacterium]
MKNLSEKTKNILIGVVVVAIVIAAYVFLIGGEDKNETELLVVAGTTAQAPGAQVGGMVAILNQLKFLTIDTDIFPDSALIESLEDFRIKISPEAKGRDNPFLPVGEDAS